MTDEQLRNLLKQGDRSAPELVSVRISPSLLKRRIHHRMFRRVVFVCLTSMAALVLWRGPWQGEHAEARDEANRVAHLEAEMKRLQATADRFMEKMDRLMEQQQLDVTLEQVRTQLQAAPNLRHHAAEMMDQAALALIEQADALVIESGQRHVARKLYFHVLDLYPNSRAAQAAERRLDQMRKTKLKEPDKGAELWPAKEDRSC